MFTKRHATMICRLFRLCQTARDSIYTASHNTDRTVLSCLACGVNWHNSNRVVAPPILADRGRITKQSSVCFPVSVGRLELKCFQLAAKSSGRPQQLQLYRQPVPCSRCSDRESHVADSSTCPRHDEVNRRRSTQCRPSGLL